MQKLGYELIKDDPNRILENGRFLKDIIERENLVLLNSSPLCQGVIARHRVTKNNEENSVIDFIITCDKLSIFLEKMVIV